MKTNQYILLSIISLISLAPVNMVNAQKLNLIIGTYTNKGTSEGIYVYEFDTSTGKASYKNKATGVNDPSYVALNKEGNFLYAVNEGSGDVSSFSFDKTSGTLKFLNKKPSNGSAPCYIVIDKDNRYVIAANYSGGSFSVYPVQKDGSLGEAAQTIQHSGSSVNKERQERSHVHSAVFSPEEDHLIVSDLGTDQISIYRFNSAGNTQPVSTGEYPFVDAGKGSGPRHFEFHPNGKFAYSIQELNGNISAFGYNKGKLSLLQNISMVDPAFKGETGAADIHVSPDGKFLYSSNRGDANDIAIFAIAPKTGKLSLKGRTSSMGKGPRNFVIDPEGNFLLAANQYSDSIVIFKRNKTTGMLTDTGERIKVGAPVCLKFA
ncbi:lactonase family protein, partial [Pararcticibacter amylolyticus]